MNLCTIYSICRADLIYSSESLFQVQDVEFAQIQIKVVEGLKQGNEALDQMHQVRGPIEPKLPHPHPVLAGSIWR